MFLNLSSGNFRGPCCTRKLFSELSLFFFPSARCTLVPVSYALLTSPNDSEHPQLNNFLIFVVVALVLQPTLPSYLHDSQSCSPFSPQPSFLPSCPSPLPPSPLPSPPLLDGLVTPLSPLLGRFCLLSPLRAKAVAFTHYRNVYFLLSFSLSLMIYALCQRLDVQDLG